jgi:hypothetical protein
MKGDSGNLFPRQLDSALDLTLKLHSGRGHGNDRAPVLVAIDQFQHISPQRQQGQTSQGGKYKAKMADIPERSVEVHRSPWLSSGIRETTHPPICLKTSRKQYSRAAQNPWLPLATKSPRMINLEL